MEKTYTQHLNELRIRLLIVFATFLAFTVLSYCFADIIYMVLAKPLIATLGHGFISTGIAEVFVTYVKVSCLGGALFAAPMLLYQIYSFISPGLYKSEKVIFRIAILASPVLFLSGLCVSYFIVIPKAWEFLFSIGAEGNVAVDLQPKVNEYFSTITKLLVAFGVCFQLPIVIFILFRLNIIGIESLRKRRRIAYLIVFIFAGIVTPPDILSHFALALPMIFLYEISILVCKIFPDKNNDVRFKVDQS